MDAQSASKRGRLFNGLAAQIVLLAIVLLSCLWWQRSMFCNSPVASLSRFGGHSSAAQTTAMAMCASVNWARERTGTDSNASSSIGVSLGSGIKS